MQLRTQSLTKSINKAYYKQSIGRSDIDTLKNSLNKLYQRIDEKESEEHLKNILSDFLKEALYKGNFEINTKDRIDLAIHNGKASKDTVGVIIEVKRPQSPERMTLENINCKALHELILYYFEERNENSNVEVKHLATTNVFDWFIFDENEFDKFFYRNTKLQKLYKAKLEQSKDNPFFYSETQKIIAELDDELTCTHFNLKEFEKVAINNDSADDKLLIELYKILSPEHLLKLPFSNDSNSLNKEFYNELLHIIGLEEIKEGSKKLISRKKPENRVDGSLLENTTNILRSEGCLDNMGNLDQYGETQEERIFSIGLELCINWLNRILFLKLLEGQLIGYHRGNKDFTFLNSKNIADFDELNELFFEVLAVKTNERSKSVNVKFGNIPYLNSSLFERSELENKTIRINSLKDRLTIPLYKNTVIKEADGKRTLGEKATLNYLFDFLEAYDFASESTARIQEQNKSMINASVLGLIFEKINGYKDGSFFTPGFITMYMCRETLRRATLQKFNDRYNWQIEEFEGLKEKIEFTDKTARQEANELINSLKICDPAVGSGHFLVSALNELISIKSDLGVLQQRDGARLRGFKIGIENDELIVIDEETDRIFEYTLNQNSKPISELQAIQETIFHEKQTIIENCLFGVDINPKSVMICRLRLWIELLKNAYYTKESNFAELETLPNIDINIKCGNSLISRFPLDADLSKALKSIKYDIKAYRGFVNDYKNAHDKQLKRGLEQIINSIKSDFRSEIYKNDPKVLRLNKLGGELYGILNQQQMFEPSAKEKTDRKQQAEKLQTEINKLSTDIEDIKSNAIFRNAFEWRFEFPEVLDEKGDFVGFDVVIGNPPYIRHEEISEQKPFLQQRFEVYNSISDLLTYFVEQGFNILKGKGLFQFIISNKFTRANYGQTLRIFLKTKTNITHFLDLSGIPVFDEATVDAAIVGFEKCISNGNCLIYANITKNKIELNDFSNYVHTIKKNFLQSDLTDISWAFESSIVLQIKHKVEIQGLPLKDWDISINYGIKTGLNDAFVVDRNKRDEFIKQDPKSSEILKPLLRGRDLQKWNPEFQDLWLIATFPSKKYNIDDYPVIKEYLQSFGKSIEQSGEKGARKKSTNKWFETQDNIGYWQDFEKAKIIYPNMTKYLPFVLDIEAHFYHNDKSFHLISDRIYWLGSFFNSKLFEYCFRDNFPELLGGTRELRKVFFDKIPVKYISEDEELPFKEKILEIFSLKKDNKETSAIETEIDQLVYQLYGLTDEEIKIVEGGV